MKSCLPLVHLRLLTLLATSSVVHAQEVFRETTFSYGAQKHVRFVELDPNTKRVFTGEHLPQATMKRHVPKNVTLDLAGATGAELSVEYWGGHIGTGGQRFQVNGHGWVDLPQPVGTVVEPQRFFRTLLGNNAVPVPLAHLKPGANTVQFAAGAQVAYSFDWGMYWIYDFTVRVAYDPAKKPHPVGEMTIPKAGTTFSDVLTLETTATSPNGDIVRVDYIGEYDDFDWDGDGVWREWQYATTHGVLHHHLGTAIAPPWRVRFDAAWLPDQSQPIRVRARITDRSGLTYLTKPVEGLVQQRAHRGVRMIKPDLVPERWEARNGRESKKGSITLTDADLKDATFARLVVSTWSGNVEDTSVHELRLNGERLAARFGEFHNYDLNYLEVPLARLKPGSNEISLYSTFKGHAIEINWPGPALLIEYKK